MAINWSNPKISIGEYESVYSGSILVHNEQKNIISFEENVLGNGNTDKITLEIKFITDGGNQNITMDFDAQRLGYLCITFFNINDLIFGTTDFAKFPFIIDDKEYGMTFFLTSLPTKTIRLFNYSILRKGQ